MFTIVRASSYISRACLSSSNSGRFYSTITDGSGIQLGGIYPPLTTPFNADESIAFDQLEANLTKYAKIPFAGIVVQGSNGEYPYLEKEEKLQIVKFVKELIKDSKKPLIAGSGCECKQIAYWIVSCSRMNHCYPIIQLLRQLWNWRRKWLVAALMLLWWSLQAISRLPWM